MIQTRKQILKHIDDNIIEERINQVDCDYLEFEVKMAKTDDLIRISDCLYTLNVSMPIFKKNPHNSILLYITGLTDRFDFNKARSDTIDGSPPDIDIDHDALDREKAIQWCIDYWGRERVANIITHGTFKPKSLARSFYRITEGNNEELNELLAMIPPPKYGKEATLEEILEENPDLTDEKKYKAFLDFADRIENMVSNFGIHAAGIIISDTEINERLPLWKNSKADRITQYDKDECEELGLLKFDFLGIDTLSIIKECQSLVKENHDIEIEPYAIPDGDELAYKYLNKGHLTGIFQMETSGIAKKLILKIKPKSIEDLSAISAINRPGPLQAGLDKTYITNKLNNCPPNDLPENVAEILKSSYWTLIYQEQIMRLFTDLAGFTAQEADDIRRAMGKKKLDVLEKYKEAFISGAQKVGGLLADYANSLWEDIAGFADYCLAGNTSVVLASQSNTNEKRLTKTISELVETQYNDNVLSLNIKEKPSILSQKTTQWHNKGMKETYRYTFEDGSFIDCTENHKILTKTLKMQPIDFIYQTKQNIYVQNEQET